MSKRQDGNDTTDLHDSLTEDMLGSRSEEGSGPSSQAGSDPEQMELDVSGSIDALATGEAVDTLKKQLAEAEDRALRTQAELENYRRRARRELEEERKYAFQPLLVSLFPVIDNIDRAIEAAQQAEDTSGLLEGFRMVAQQLVDTLQTHSCTRIEALGQPFDPALHEAISQQPSDQYPSGTVALVTQVGYQLHDRVIRPAQVIVSTGPAE